MIDLIDGLPWREGFPDSEGWWWVRIFGETACVEVERLGSLLIDHPAFDESVSPSDSSVVANMRCAPLSALVDAVRKEALEQAMVEVKGAVAELNKASAMIEGEGRAPSAWGWK